MIRKRTAAGLMIGALLYAASVQVATGLATLKKAHAENMMTSLPGAFNRAGRDEKIRVIDSILGIRIGTSLEEVHKKLKSLGTFGGRGTRTGGRREAWTLKETEFSSIAYQTSNEGRVMWVTGFVRPGKEIPFSQLGDLASASAKDNTEVVWTVRSAEGSYRLVAKGPDSKARVVYLLSIK